MTETKITYQGKTYTYRPTRPDFYVIECEDGYVTAEACTATSSPLSAVGLLAEDGH